jgi:hypothetical protein
MKLAVLVRECLELDSIYVEGGGRSRMVLCDEN